MSMLSEGVVQIPNQQAWGNTQPAILRLSPAACSPSPAHLHVAPAVWAQQGTAMYSHGLCALSAEQGPAGTNHRKGALPGTQVVLYSPALCHYDYSPG